MLTPRAVLRRLRALFLPQRAEDDLEQELAFHLQMDAETRMRHGTEGREARARAERELGGVLRVKDECRDNRGVRALEDFAHDIRFALRGLIRKPAFTGATLITFALGVGGTAGVFGAIHAILLSPLPYANPEQLAFASELDVRRNFDRQGVSPGNFLDWRQRNTSFEAIASFEPNGLDWVSPDGPEYLSASIVSEGFFDLLGVPALHGRTFRPEEHRQGAGPVAVLGHALWLGKFGGDPAIIGRTFTFDGQPFVVVGIMPADFALPRSDIVWAPKIWRPQEAQMRSSAYLTVVGRLKPGVTLARAHAELGRVAAQLSEEHPATNASTGVNLVALPDQILGWANSALLLLFGAVGLVLLVAAANLTSLQLARAIDRGREFAVRAALGAGRGRVVRQVVAESLVLALAGSILGFGLAATELAILRPLLPAGLPHAEHVRGDWTVFAFAVGLGILTAVLAGLYPALTAARSAPARGLQIGGRTATAGRGTRRFRSALVVGQIATALVLLVGAGLLVRSLQRLLNEERGFRIEGVVVAVSQIWQYYPTPEARIGFVHQALERIDAMPGVEAAGMTSMIPLATAFAPETAPMLVSGRAVAAAQTPTVNIAAVTAGFFRTLEIPLTHGRLFGADDRRGAAPVAIVNRALAEQFFPGEPAVGRRITLGSAQTGGPEIEIVGVVGDVRRYTLQDAGRPTAYIPQSQAGTGAVGFVLRTGGDPDLVVKQLKEVVREMNAAMPFSYTTTMDQLLGNSLRQRRFLIQLLGSFSVIALALAATGIFGVMSYTIGERTREIGVRMAFGADRLTVLGMVLRDGGRLAAAGIVIGVASAAAATRFLAGMLYGVPPLDPAAFFAGIGVLAAVALGAMLVPARRAARLAPLEALRTE